MVTFSAPAGTKRLTEVARYVVKPDGIVDTNYRLVAPRLKAMGIEFDEWQRSAGKLMLGLTSDGKYAATVGGVGISICRQAGKTYMVGSIVFALCTLIPGLTVIWTSHHMKTTGEIFLALQGFAARMKIAPYIDDIFLGSGDEEIRFKNGSRILFGARERGFGRGFSDVDILVFDEGQILSDKALDNMLPAMNAAPNPLPIFMGTPPKPEDSSEAWMRMRKECLDNEVNDTVWIECGAQEGCDPYDKKHWAIANPSFPNRTPVTAMKRLQRKLTPESWLREGLGVYRAEDTAVFDLRRWASPPLLNRQAAQPDRVTMVIAVAPDRSWSSIGVAGDSDGKTLVMCYSAKGIAWVAPKIVELRQVRSIDGIYLVGGQAKAVKADLTREGIEFEVMSQQDEGAGCATFLQAYRDGTVEHVGQGDLDVAVANARTRRTGVGEVEIWDSPKSSVDISPLRACSGALYQWGLRDRMPVIY